jgi:hypothetical protein
MIGLNPSILLASRLSRNFQESLTVKNQPQKSPQPPFHKGGLGGFLELAGCEDELFDPDGG